jgi:hypothetical protein
VGFGIVVNVGGLVEADPPPFYRRFVMAKTLDRSKDFGEIFGGGKGRYVQGDAIFDAAGNELIEEASVAGAPVKNGKKGNDVVAPVAVAEPGQASLLDDQLAAQAGVTE